MKLVKTDQRVSVLVEDGDFPQGVQAFQRKGESTAFDFRNNRYFTLADLGAHIDQLVQLEEAWNEYLYLSQMAPK